MIYLCADDYGISAESNHRIEACLTDGALNKISVLPNGDIADLKHLSGEHTMLTLHLNLVEGRPLSNPADIPLLTTDTGLFRYSFIGLFLQSVSPKRKHLEQQLYHEIQRQIQCWTQTMGVQAPVSIDSHQHTHMIPLVFKTLLHVIKDEGLDVRYLRIPAEPLSPYLLSPSLYLSYSPVGLVKQWLLKFFALVNRKEFKRSNIPTAYFMGVLFSGKMTESTISKLLPHYLKLANKHGRNIELGFHPGYSEPGEQLICGSRADFGKFYSSPWRRAEYDTLMKLKL